MAVDPLTIAKVATTIGKLGTDKNGRWIILTAVLTPLILVLLILSSPFAIFFSLFSDGNSENIPVQTIMQELQNDLIKKIELEENDSKMDTIKTIVVGSEDNTLIDNSIQVLSFFSVINTTKEGQQVAYLDNKSKQKLENIFWEMNIIKVDIDKKTHTKTVTNRQGISSVKTITTYHKTITINSLTEEEMAIQYGFSQEQKKILKEVILSSDLIMPVAANTYLSKSDIENIKSFLPPNLSIERKFIVKNALSLVGKVNYFWGGKSLADGWDDRWGIPTKVTSVGSSTTGTLRPFGLDCSGYITWVFANLGLNKPTIEKTIGHGTTAQWNLSTAIDKSQVIEGDLAFLTIPNTRKINHVGIVIGINDDGKVLVAHCNASDNNVSIDTATEIGLRYFRRPAILIKGADTK